MYQIHSADGSKKTKLHFIKLREDCAPEEASELDNIINTYDDIA